MRTIRTSDEFKTAYKRLKKKYRSLEADFGALLVSLQENPRQGVEILDDIWKISKNEYHFQRAREKWTMYNFLMHQKGSQ